MDDQILAVLREIEALLKERGGFFGSSIFWGFIGVIIGSCATWFAQYFNRVQKRAPALVFRRPASANRYWSVYNAGGGTAINIVIAGFDASGNRCPCIGIYGIRPGGEVTLAFNPDCSGNPAVQVTGERLVAEYEDTGRCRKRYKTEIGSHRNEISAPCKGDRLVLPKFGCDDITYEMDLKPCNP